MSQMGNDLLLEIKDLRLNFTTYDGVSKVLAGVNLKMHRGDVLGLVGELVSRKMLVEVGS